jgi:hypothetical protein
MNPHDVTAETVEQVKRRLRGSTSLLYATSENAEASKWMAWELGLGDGFSKKVAIVPISGGYGQLKTREFLQVYPEVQDGSGGTPLWVKYPNGDFRQFAIWLAGW